MLNNENYFPGTPPQEKPNPAPIPHMYGNPMPEMRPNPHFRPHTPNFTVQEEFINTTRRVNETLDRVLKMEENIRRTLEGFTSTISADNVAFKNLCATTYNQFVERVTAEVNTFESEISNTYEAFQTSVKNDFDNLATNFEEFKEEVNTKTDEFETGITNALNTYKEELNATYEEFRSAVDSRLEQYNSTYVQAFNDYVTEMNLKLTTMQEEFNDNYNSFVTQTNASITQFKTQWTKSIDERLDGQDSVISDAVLYMKTNLRATLENLVDEMVLAGEIDTITTESYKQLCKMGANALDYGADEYSTSSESAEAINNAFKVNDIVIVPPGTYYTESPIEVGEGQTLILNGDINCFGECGVIITGSNVLITGNGSLKNAGVTEGWAGVRIELKGTRKNIKVENITIAGNYHTNNTRPSYGVHIKPTPGTKGEGCYYNINCYIHSCEIGVYLEDDRNSGDGTWCNGVNIDSTIENCLQAVNFAFGGGGSTLNGAYQPILNTSSPNTDERPFVLIRSNVTVIAQIWDMGTMVNKIGIEMTGGNNKIAKLYNGKYISYSGADKYTQDIWDEKYPPNRSHGYEQIDDIANLSQINNILPYFLLRKGNTAKISRITTDGTETEWTEQAWLLNDLTEHTANRVFYFSSTEVNGLDVTDIVLTFEFAEKIPLREVSFFGENTPDKTTIMVKVNDEWHTFAELERGKDYGGYNGKPNFVCARYIYSEHNSLIGNWAYGECQGVKIIMDVSQHDIGIANLFIGTPRLDFVSKHGGFMNGLLLFTNDSGVALMAPGGRKYRLIVDDDGNLSTEICSGETGRYIGYSE